MAARLAVVGAGPAGLIAAITARKLGLEVAVFEQAADFKPVGGGLMVHSNGLRVLDCLGLLDEMRPVLRFTQVAAVELPGGRRLATFDYRKLDIPQNRMAAVMRYALQDHLLNAAVREGADVRFGHRCEAIAFEAEAARLRFGNGDDHFCEVVIASDGIHSRARESAGLPARRRPIAEAYLRGVAELRTDCDTIREIWGPDGRRFGICPLAGDRTYFFCSVAFGGWQDILERGLEGWVESWASFGKEVAALLAAVPDWRQVNYSELQEVELRRWYRPPVFVVGDAAHAMTPNLGQGANSAMVDSLVLMQLLARALAEGGDLEEAGKNYQGLRWTFVARTQRAARQTGMMAGWTAAPVRALRNLLLAQVQKVDRFEDPATLLAAGYHPDEDPYLRAIAPPQTIDQSTN
jgi:2-polyprenyl-6-methoxyphenol hydroxylase-like FAD-dependent oxidoreductase